MKTISKSLTTITKVLMVTLLIAGVSSNSFAQDDKKSKKAKKEKVIKRPGDSGHAATNKFVNSSFDVYERNQKLTAKLSDVKGNAGDAGKIKTDLEAQLKETVGLLGQSKDVMATAKSITPKTNSIKAVKALNTAIKALTVTKDAIPGQIDMIKNQEGK